MALGLYFDNENIGLVETRKSRGGIELFTCYKSLMGDAAIKEGLDISELRGEVSPELKIVANLQKAIREAKISSNEVVFSLPTKELIVRIFKMPKLPKKEWEDSIRFEAKKYIPFLIEDVISTFFVKAGLKDKDMEVLFIACPKKTVSRYLSLLKEADLNIVALEAEIFSILRLIQPKLKKEKTSTVAILKWFGSSGFIMILEKGTPRVVRDFSVPIVRNIDEDQISQRLANEMRLSMSYYKKEFGVVDVGKIYLCVDEKNSGWSEALQKNLGISVDVLFPFSIITKTTIPIDNTPVSYTALGASLRGILKFPFPIDLAAERKLFKYHYEMSKGLKTAMAVFALLILVVYGVFQIQVGKVKGKLSAVVAKRPATKITGNPAVEELDNLRIGREKKIKVLKNLIDKRQYLTFKLESIVNSLPDGVWIDDLVFSERVADDGSSFSELKILGSAFLQDKEAELNAVNKFVSGLKSEVNFVKNFKKVDLTYVKQIEEQGFNVTTFELKCSP